MWRIEYLAPVVAKDIPALPKRAAEMIKAAIESRLTTDPVGYGKPLRCSLKGHRRLRVDDYRVVYRIDLQRRAVVISVIRHRKDVYDD